MWYNKEDTNVQSFEIAKGSFCKFSISYTAEILDSLNDPLIDLVHVQHE